MAQEDGEPLVATDILPFELWEEILGKIDTPEGVHNCYATCKDWRNIIGKPTILLQKVIRILSEKNYLSSNEILVCRLVCRKWKAILDLRLVPGPTSMWRITCELIAKSLFVNAFGDNVFETRGGSLYATHAMSPKGQFHIVMYPHSREKLMHGDPHFMELMRTLKYSPCHTRTLYYHIDLQRDLFIPLSVIREDYFNCIRYENGNKCWGLFTEPDERTGMLNKFLVSLFQNFAPLKSLRLQVTTSEMGPIPEKEPILVEIESRGMAYLQMLKQDNGTRLNNLVALVLEDAGYYSRVVTFPLLMSTLIGCAPKLEKLQLVFLSTSLYNKDVKSLGMVLGAVARSPAVTQLELMGWDDKHRLDELVPPVHHSSWPLRKLSIGLKRLATLESVAGRVLRCFLGVLRRLEESLEDLYIGALSTDCVVEWNGTSLGRVCSCNDYYNKYKSYKRVPEFSQIAENGNFQHSFFKLKTLRIPHVLLHPAIFPGIMAVCPVLEDLHLAYDMDVWWNGKDALSTVDALKDEFIFGLWKEAPPPLYRIWIDKVGNPRDNIRFVRGKLEGERSSRSCSSTKRCGCAKCKVC